MGDEKFTHPSLRPPPHGYPPNEAPQASWVLLDLHAYVADRENATSASGRMSNGKVIRVTFCTAPPPLVSYISVWCPDDEIAMEPTVEAAQADLVLLRVSLRSRRQQGDYFVYKATGGKGPSLRLLQDPKPCLPERYNVTLLSHRDVHKRGPGDDHYYVVVLNQFRGSGPGDFKLWVFNSEDEKWSIMPISLEGIGCHITSKVIAVREGGLLGFVDPWRGIIVCDVLGRKPAHYLPLPPHLIRLDKFGDDPLLCRDIAFIKGRISVIELSPVTEDYCHCSWKLSSWSRVVTKLWEKDWQTDYTIQSSDVIVDSNADNVSLLPNPQDGEDTLLPTLGKLYIAHPTLSLSDKDIVYIMGKVNRLDKKALVLSLDMRTSKLQEVAMFDAERMLGITFGYTYTHSRISKYFDVAPVKRIAKDKAKKRKSVSENIVPVKDTTKKMKQQPSQNKAVRCSKEDLSDSKDELKKPSPASASAQKGTLKYEKPDSDYDDESDEDVPGKATVPTVKKEESCESSGSDSYSDSKDEDGVTKTSQLSNSAAPKKKEKYSEMLDTDSPERPTIPAKRTLPTDTKNGQDDSDESSYSSSNGYDEEPPQKKLKDIAPSGAAKPATKVAKKACNHGQEDDGCSVPATKVAKKKVSCDEDIDDDSSEERFDGDNHKQITSKKLTAEEGIASDEESNQPTKDPKKKPDTLANNQTPATGSKTLFVGNLSSNVELEQVKQFFEEAGKVVDINFATTNDGSFKGIAHVKFATAEAAKKALRFSGHSLMNRPVRLNLVREKNTNTTGTRKDNNSFKHQCSGNTIFIKGFDKSLGKDQIESSLKEHFDPCGEITCISVPLDRKTGASKGIAFLDFEDHSSLSKAFNMNGSELGGFSLYVDEARPKPNGRDGGGGCDDARHGGDRGRGTLCRQGSGTVSAGKSLFAGKKITFSDSE